MSPARRAIAHTAAAEEVFHVRDDRWLFGADVGAFRPLTRPLRPSRSKDDKIQRACSFVAEKEQAR